MTGKPPKSEYLVLSRGKWDPQLPQERIQGAIDAFYVWHDRCVAEGSMRAGQRLQPGGRTVSRRGTTDGPFAESKEVIGGYWTILAASLDEAAALAAQNPCIACGLEFEIRPIEPARARADVFANETPLSG
ncbi:YciI family protein [Luteimonas sp. RD2P54]|uniref:YciI family protein n=1 Tax=Luteimonas endophytica TaxID=3042023 RepID=A0ABT6JAX8_9GAMM|nr:YciI family protein [Luteimonas endophytica]MDH5823976.1 YciI family protein [Luteimonas endophytica]